MQKHLITKTKTKMLVSAWGLGRLYGFHQFKGPGYGCFFCYSHCFASEAGKGRTRRMARCQVQVKQSSQLSQHPNQKLHIVAAAHHFGQRLTISRIPTPGRHREQIDFGGPRRPSLDDWIALFSAVYCALTPQKFEKQQAHKALARGFAKHKALRTQWFKMLWCAFNVVKMLSHMVLMSCKDISLFADAKSIAECLLFGAVRWDSLTVVTGSISCFKIDKKKSKIATMPSTDVWQVQLKEQ